MRLFSYLCCCSDNDENDEDEIKRLQEEQKRIEREEEEQRKRDADARAADEKKIQASMRKPQKPSVLGPAEVRVPPVNPTKAVSRRASKVSQRSQRENISPSEEVIEEDWKARIGTMEWAKEVLGPAEVRVPLVNPTKAVSRRASKVSQRSQRENINPVEEVTEEDWKAWIGTMESARKRVMDVMEPLETIFWISTRNQQNPEVFGRRLDMMKTVLAETVKIMQQKSMRLSIIHQQSGKQYVHDLMKALENIVIVCEEFAKFLSTCSPTDLNTTSAATGYHRVAEFKKQFSSAL